MTDHRTATLTEATARLTALEALARDVNDPHLAEWVRKLSNLMHEILHLAGELRIAADDRSPCRDRPRVASAEEPSWN